MAELIHGRRWKVVLAYDGTEFHGWQVQPSCVTVQGELQGAIERVTGEAPLPQGSGRTDAGVHALGQVASFTLSAPIPKANLVRALNRTLPAAIRVLSAEIATDDFHARHSANSKTYQYRIFRGETCPPWQARYAYAFPRPIDLGAMEAAAGYVLGEHDFTSFAATDPDLIHRDGLQEDSRADPRGNVRAIFRSEWTTQSAAALDITMPSSETMLIYHVRGDGFLHHMVRNLVGTFLEVGRGNLKSDQIPKILAARSRSCAGPTAPARGLFLTEVEYPEDLHSKRNSSTEVG